MQSTFYRSAVQKGKLEGIKENARRSVMRVLVHRLGFVDEGLQARIEAEEHLPVLEAWQDAALSAVDEAAAGRLAEQIRKAPAPPPRP